MVVRTPPAQDDSKALNTILTRTQHLLKVDVDDDTVFQKAQLLLSEYMAMLTDTQLENRRLRALLGSYVNSRYAAERVPASALISRLHDRVRELEAVTATLQVALEKIRKSEKESPRNNSGAIAAAALRKLARPDKRAARK